MATRIGVFLAAWLVTCGSVAAAQDTASSFQDVSRVVKVGDTVTVTDSTGASNKGTIAELTPSSLVLSIGIEQRRYAEADVTRVGQRRQDSLLNGLLIGAAGGAVFGGLGAASCANDFGCSDPTAAFLALGIGVGAGIGLAIDAAITSNRVIYQRPSTRTTTLHLAPMLGSGRAGAVLSLAY